MKCAISGSFKKFYAEICQAYEIFEQNGISVLSPRKSTVVNPAEEFVILASDGVDASIKQIEDRHLEAISESDFLYLVNPRGYVGSSAAFEMGYAIDRNKRVYSLCKIEDMMLREYVTMVWTPWEVLSSLRHPYPCGTTGI